MHKRIKIFFIFLFSVSVFLAGEGARAETVTYTVNFASSIEGFAYVNESCSGGGTCTQGFTSADGSPPGSIFAKVVGKSKKNLGYFKESLTWEDMGVPAGAIVLQVDGSFAVKLAQETHAAVNSIGLKLYDSADSVIIFEGGTDLETEFDPTSSAWTTRNSDGAKQVLSAYQSSDTAVTIRMRMDVNSGNNNSASTEVRADTLVFTITYEIPAAGSLSVDVVDSGDAAVASPTVSFGAKVFDWIAQSSTGTLGTASQKIRISNTTATPTWTLSFSATSGPTALWQSGVNNYDFNGASAAGRLQVNASGATITPQSGCVSTGLTKGSATYFVQGSQDSINLIIAGSGAQTNCFWDITGITLTQDIPASQPAGSYILGMTLTAT